MLILHKAFVEYCPVRRSEKTRIELGIKFKAKLFYPCARFDEVDFHDAAVFHRSYREESLVVSEGGQYAVYCYLPALERAEPVKHLGLNTLAAV
ncbi:MAG: hypothetical protein H7Y22_15755 [Gemmatimonadaceae bacterium]|nr:hypothetical protein [Gloeobacterales cyanobacterium ES-bin-141]